MLEKLKKESAVMKITTLLLIILTLQTVPSFSHWGIESSSNIPSQSEKKTDRFNEVLQDRELLKKRTPQRTASLGYSSCCKKTALMIASAAAYFTVVGGTVYCMFNDQCPMH